MGGKKHSSKTLSKQDAHHPHSRHAFQRARVMLRQRRLNEAKTEKTHLPDLYSFHDFISTFYLSRHDDELAELRKEQRPGRPKSKRLADLEAQVAAEKQEYYEGMDVPDLCNEVNVSLLREWEGDPQGIPLFRFVRISSSERDSVRVVHAGTHKRLQEQASTD